MKILFLAENYKNWIASTLYYEQKAIQNILPGSVFYGPGFQCRNSYVPEIISEIYGFSKPDVIFCYINEKRLLNKPMPNEISSRYAIPESLKVFPTGLHKVTVPRIAWINDFWHCSRQEWDRILIGNGFDMAFATYCPPFIRRDIFNRFFSKKVQEKVIFVPWPRAVATDTFTDYKLKKIYDLVLLGAMDENFYPLRLKMHNAFSKLRNIQYHHKSHPGYRFCGNNDLVGSKYAECINQSRIFASCTGKYNIPFIKIYEALACGSLLMCDSPQGAEYLGLKENENYLPVNENNFIDIALDYLAKPETCDEISRNGRDLIAKKHTVEIRATQFVEVLDCILNKNRAIDWVELSPNWKQLAKKKNDLKIKNDKYSNIMGNKNQSKVQCMNNTIFNNELHITDLVKCIDKNTYDIWYKYGANFRVEEEPPVVTKYPELVMLRGFYLKEMARKIKAQTLVEVGTARGFQSFMWARYLLESQYSHGKIITCDIVGMNERIFKTPITGQKYFTREELWKDTLEAKHVTFVQGDSLKMAKLINREIDLLYIDGEHTADAVLYDLKNLSPFFHKKSVIVFDDCDERFPGIQKAVNEISSDLGLKPQIISFTPSRYKIAIVELEQSHQDLIHNENILSNNTLSNYDEKIELCEEHEIVYERWFKKICIPYVLKMSENDPIVWQGSSLAWDAYHEIMAYHVFTDGKIPIETLLYLSNNRYKLLEELWPKGELTKKLVDDFYIKSAGILPWGHGVFIADHNVYERRNNWKRRIEILKMIKKLGSDSICDYGAGGGHTTLLAKTMGFKRIVHHEYSVFHPYVKWRSDNIGNFGDHTQKFELSRAEDGLKLSKSVDVVLCMDVAEHVWDPMIMLEEINNSLEPGGYLIWNSVFGEGISCHFHPELQGKENKVLNDYGFHRVEDLKVRYSGYSGLYQKKFKSKKAIVTKKSEILKPKVLFIVDKPNWAHDYKTRNLQKQLSNEYVIEKVYCDNIKAEDIENADLVGIYYWGQILNEKMQKLLSVIKKNKHKLLLGICSHNEMSGSDQKFGLEVLKEYASAIFVNNRSLFEEFSSFFDVPVFYTPNGVDTEFFKPRKQNHKSAALRVGWAGSLKNHGDIRGYYEYILKAVESVRGIELVTAAREDVWRTHQQMMEFYNRIDVYICASRTEGTPNPCLEAAACGLPLLTTSVGNMPELIENGVNGFFIKRDVDDIVDKLTLLRDNSDLRTQLSTKAREHILNWDWQKKAQNYKHMFEAVLTAKSQRNSLFRSSEQVYLASADKIDSVLKNCQQFNNVPNRHINSYVSVIGGLSGLNYLAMMAPQTITFFDVNYCAVEYLKCLLEIIDISKGCRDFISRVFCRSIDMFLNANSYDELTVDNQHQYLDMKFDQNIYFELMSLLTPFSQRIYKKYLEPHLSCRILSGVRNCKQLVPCYPFNERVPVGGGEESGWNEYGDLVPNLNTFFYGYGWLSSDNAFNCVKTILKTTKVQLMVFNLFQDEIDLLADFSGHVVIHCSNIDDWFSEKWAKWRLKALQKSIRKRGELTLITTNGGVKHSFFDPHTKAFESIKPYVYGKIVEVTHKIPWGFHEFKRDIITCDDYINGNCPISDTTIIHNLAGEGISHIKLEKVCRLAAQKSQRIIILEHNKKSSDWNYNSNNKSFMTISHLIDKLNEIMMPLNAYIHPVINIPGHYDLSRNIMFVIDTVNTYNLEECKSNETIKKRKNVIIEDKIVEFSNKKSIYETKTLTSDSTRTNYLKKSYKEVPTKPETEDQTSAEKDNILPYQKTDPLVSVIVPTYNRPYWLPTTLKSILSQTYQNFEIIVMNDAGQDVEHIVAGLNEKNNITYVRHCRNRGLAAARNTGIKIAKGKYIAYLDDDDIFYPEHLSTLVEHLENSDFKVAYTDAYRSHQIHRDGENVVQRRDLPYSFDFDRDRMLVGNYIPVLCFMHAKSCINEIGLFDENLSSHEDWDFWIRMSQEYKFSHIKQITAEFAWLTDGSTMTSGNRTDMLLTMKMVYHKHADLVKEKPHIALLQKQNLKVQEKQIIPNKKEIKCSIVIPVHNQWEYTQNCLKAMYEVTDIQGGFEVIVVDNASTDNTPSFLNKAKEKYPGFLSIRNQSNFGFAKACNQGAKQSNGYYLVFLNNDTLPQPGWLDEMIKTAEKDSLVGVVGSKLLYPDGTIQHAGVYFNEHGIPYHAFRSARGDHPAVLVTRETPGVTGACMLMPKQLFHHIGGFNEDYHMYVEDVDLCLCAWDAGFKVVYCAESVLTHFESASITDVNRRDAQVREAWNHLHKSWRNKWPTILQELTPEDSSRKIDLNYDPKCNDNALQGSTVLWHAPIFDPSGYADEARNFILQLQRKNIKPVVREIGRNSDVFRNGLEKKSRARLDEAIAQETPEDFISIIQFPAYAFERIPKARYHIGRTTFETDDLPADWVQKCNLMDEIWVPSEFNMQTFKAAGVTSKLFKVPEGVESERFRPGLDALKIPGTRGVVFLSIFEWIYRKGWDVLLKSWAKAFGPGDDVSLVLRTYPMNATDRNEAKQKIEGRINHFIETELKICRHDVAPIIVLTEQLHEQDMPRLYAAADAYVLPSRGEGWGRTQMEAMACGLPVLSTRWSGNLEFMNDHNSFLIDINGLAVIDERAEIPFYRGQKWAEPSVEHLGELMLKIVEKLTGVRKIGRRARLDIERYWGWERIAAIAAKRLRAINTEIEHHSVTTCGSNAAHTVMWEGSQFVNHSLALVNRELCIELAKRKDVELSLIPYEPDEFGVGEDPARFGLIEERLRKPLSGGVDFHVRHQWPPNFTPPPEGHWIIIQPWEFGALPKDWIEPMETLTDELWVPSNHVRDVYINSGITPDKVFVVPNGVNYDQFNPQTPKLKLATTKRFKFLFVGGTIMRKGIDILLSVYTETFTSKDDVCLVTKDMGGESFYRGQNASQVIEDIKKDPASPEILYLTGTLKHEEIAGLYTACDCLVHPYRGEGFGLPVAEAMACGLPVIVTKGGACDDFCSEKNAYLIDSTVRSIHLKSHVLSAPGWLLEPDKLQLMEMLRFVYEQPEEAEEKGTIAARQIRQEVDWKISADQIMARLKALKGKPVRRFTNLADSQAVQARKSAQEIYQSIQQSMKNKRPEEVINELEMLAESYPQFALAQNDLGVLHYQAGNREMALKFYENAVQLDPGNMIFQKNLADFYYVEMSRVEDALRIYVKLLEANPEDVETLLITGHICVAMEKFQDAEVFYSRVLEIEPGHQDALKFLDKLNSMKMDDSSTQSPEELYREIQPLLNNGDPQGAISALKRLLEKFPDFAIAHNDLGVLCYHTGNKEKAQQHYEHAVDMMPDNKNFQKNLADFYCIELGRIEDALQMYVSILKNDPQDVETLMATGQICKALEKSDDAIDFFNRALEIEPCNETARRLKDELEGPPSPAIFLVAESPEEIYQNLQSELSNLSPDEVIGHLSKLMESFPDFAIAYNDLGVLFYNVGDKEKALKHYQKAVKLEPANTTFQKNLADYYFVELDRKEEALQIYLSLLNNFPNDLELNLTAAHICVAVQNFSKAKVLYKRVLVIDPENDDARNNLRTLDKIKGDLRTDQQQKTEPLQKSTSEEYFLAKETIGVNDAPEKDIPQFSIIIPTSAPLKQIRRCVESIKKHTSESHEILLVNNGTTKGVLKWVRQCIDENHNWRVLKCGKGANPAVCYNTGIKAAKGKYIVLLSNDVIVTDGWLSIMLQCFTSIPNTGMVGTMANRARKRQKVAAAVNPSFAEINAFAETYRATNRYRRIECDILDGFCLLFRRDLTEKIGLFDEQTSALGFEDEDYCLRAALEGYVNQIAGDVYLHRLERKAPARSKKNFNLKWSGADIKSPTGKRHLALRAVEKANRAGEEGKIDLAVELFLQAIGLLPERKESYYKLAEMLVNTKRFKDALDVLNELPEGHPDARHLELAACCKEGLELFEEAEGYADQALEISRCATSALNTKGIIAFRRDDNNAAKSYFAYAMETDPGFGEAYTNLGALKWAAGLKDEALSLYERGFILSSTVPDIALNYHCALADLGEYQRAESVVRDAAAVHPHNKKIRYMLIDILIHQQNHGMALQEIETAIADFGVDDGILSSALKIREKIGPLTIDRKTGSASTVSLCMIVKDEEDHLARCLQSVRPVVDDIIVVDTGSRDRSRDIARVFGAKVFDFEWAEDFAEARNYSLSKATGKMVFVMDADEVISPLDYELFRRTARQSSRQRSAFIINTRNYTMDNNLVEWAANEGYYGIEEAGTGWTPSAKIRLFPNDPHIRFDFPVHEMVEPSLRKMGIVMKLCKFQLHHYGKLNRDKSEKKGEAYYEIGCKKLEEMGDAPVALRELAIQAEGLKKHEEAVELWEKFIAIVPNEPKAYINMGISYCSLGQFDKVLATAKKALKFAPDSKEGHYNCALAKLHLGHPDQAIEILEKLCEEMPEYLPARFILAAACCCREDKKRGMALLKELSGTAIGPGLAIRCHELAGRFVLLQRPAYALALLDAAIDSQNGNKDVLDLYADCLKQTDSHKKTGTYE